MESREGEGEALRKDKNLGMGRKGLEMFLKREMN